MRTALQVENWMRTGEALLLFFCPSDQIYNMDRRTFLTSHAELKVGLWIADWCPKPFLSWEEAERVKYGAE